MNYQKNTMKFGIKSVMVPEKNLIVIQQTIVYQFICLLVISVDSIFRTGKNYSSQVILEESKYVVKEKKIHNCITDDMEISGSDEDNSDEEILAKIQTSKNPDEEDSIEEDSDEEDSSEKN